jgi:serine/threonine-protein kinase
MTRTGSRSDLDSARQLFENVTVADPEFAAGWSGLGIANLQYVRHGFGGQIHVMTARRAFDLAYKLDPGSTEALTKADFNAIRERVRAKISAA